MEAIANISKYLEYWSTGGEKECRDRLFSHHCSLANVDSSDILASSYETLIHALLKTWNPSGPKLTSAELVAFIQNTLENLPSTSSAQDGHSANLALFGELLVNLIWAADTQLAEFIPDAKLSAPPARNAAKPTTKDNIEEDKKQELTPEKARAERLKLLAETDRNTLADLTKKLLSKNLVERDVCKDRLDTPLLASIGLLRNREAFDRKEVRVRTALFYKQNKFNLIREQSEGYTKLTVDLLGSLGPPHSSTTALPTESSDSVRARAASAWERVVGLIGYFELDPNRAMDIILDIFSANITTHWQFFLAFLSCTPWTGDCSNLSEWESSSLMGMDVEPSQYEGKHFHEILIIAEKRAKRGPRTTAGKGVSGKPKALAQALGFKFRYYQEKQEGCPRSLYLMTALLIREDFIQFEDIYPHLGPSDELMPRHYEDYLSDVQSRIQSSANNLLAMAAPLESQASSNKPKVQATQTKATVDIKAPVPQKAMIASALLAIGALRPAISILTRFPWLVDFHKEIADLLLRILSVSISPFYDKKVGKPQSADFTTSRARYGAAGILTTPSRKSQLTLIAPPPHSTHIYDFTFFYPLWADWVPICRSFSDIVNIAAPLMDYLHVHISRDPLLLTKLLRIGKLHVAETLSSKGKFGKEDGKQVPSPIREPLDSVQEFWLQMTRRHILPAISMMSGNAVCTVEVWNIIKQYDNTIRWRLYGEWRDATYKSHPELKMHQALREREAKGILRRLASQTVDSLAGTIAKMAHTNPCIFFTHAVHQIQAYDNLADVVIQALRFSTNMGFDILVFITLDALSNPHKDRVKDDGANASDWLQSLATFTGALFRRYSTDLSPVLRYIVHQLYAGQTSEIIVLEKLILKMAGIEPLPSLSNTQVEAMAGGPALRIEAIASRLRGANLDASEAGWRGPQRLGRTLVESNLAFPILVQVAQQRQACIFRAKDAHPKSLAFLFDATHGVLMQYLDLLNTDKAVPSTDYESIIPSLSALVVEFGIKPAIAMQILRPMLSAAVKDYLPKAKEYYLKKQLSTREQSTQSSEATEKSTQKLSQDESDSQATLVKMETDESEGTSKMLIKTQDIETLEYESPWVPALEAQFNECRKILPNSVHDTIGPAFYMTFWQMTLADIHYPQERYAETVKALTNARDSLDTKSRHFAGSTEKRKRTLNESIDLLKDEMNNQGLLYRYTVENGGRLDREKVHWFSHAGAGKGASFIQSLIEHCVQPRCLLSPMDAAYCSKLIRVLHARGTPGFHTLMCYDKLLGDPVKVVIFSCSENEARNYGRFLKGILSDLYIWHKDQKAYDNSNRRVEGETVTLLPGLQTKWSRDGPKSTDELMKWTEFKSFLKKCHRKLGKSLTDCLHAGEFMHVYNAIIVLKEIIEVFPIAAVNEVVGSTVDLEVQRLVQTEERGDLKILARAYSSSLTKRQKLWALPKAVQPTKPTPAKQTLPSTAGDTVKSDTVESTTATSSTLQTAQTGQQQPQASSAVERPVSRLGLESVPRPEVVKRNRTEGKAADVPNAEKGRATPDNAMQIDHQTAAGSQESSNRQLPADQFDPNINGIHRPIPRTSTALGTDLRKEVLQGANGHSRASTPLLQPSVASITKDSPLSSPAQRSQDLMAPPTAPSQKLQAQELRSSRSIGQVEKSVSSPRERQRDVIDSPSRRSPSPATRPGTRNTSAESRASSGSKRERNRRSRVSPDSDDRRRPAEGTSRAERGGGYRDVPQGRSERGTRERIPGSSTRDADREREVDQDRKRDRDKDKKDRESRREHRERDRDKADRDKERDRHRRDRDDKDRERKPSASKEAQSTAEHGGSARSESNRHRTHSDESLGKRRRAPDDEPERSAKRGSRRDGHREERPRRQELGREPVRESDHTRRKERDPTEAEATLKVAPVEKPSERPRRGDSPPPQSPRLSAPVPSGPRAMAPSPRAGPRSDTLPPVPFSRDREPDRSDRRTERSDRADRYDRTERLDRNDRGERDRGERPEREGREWRTNAEGPSAPHEAPARSGGANGSLPPLAPASNSLRERLDGGQNSFTGSSHHRGSLSSREDYGDGRKRTMSERDREAVVDVPLSGGSNSSSATTSAPKRQRVQINRNRYQGDNNSGALARKALNNLPK